MLPLSVPSFIGSKVIFWWKSCVHSNSCISWRISFKFCHRCASQSNLHTYSFWWCCPQCSVFYRVKDHILVHILVCTLTAAFLDGLLSNFVWRCIMVKSTHVLFLVMLPHSVQSFIGSNVIFWWKSFVRSAGHISWWISFKFCTDVHHSQIYTPIVFW